MNWHQTNNLHNFRSHQNLTKTKLAELCNVETSSITRWENGHRVPSLSNAFRLAQELHVPIHDLCGVSYDL